MHFINHPPFAGDGRTFHLLQTSILSERDWPRPGRDTQFRIAIFKVWAFLARSCDVGEEADQNRVIYDKLLGTQMWRLSTICSVYNPLLGSSDQGHIS